MNKDARRAQEETNRHVIGFLNNNYEAIYDCKERPVQLRRCSADVYETDTLCILRSYSTIVAAIDADGNLYDFLRYAYGYTSTSAQHIAKFRRDYSRNGKRFTYYPI